jgi:streptomycin 6-kinase
MTEDRILRWALAWGALSAVWAEADGGDATAARGVAFRARALLGGGAV